MKIIGITGGIGSGKSTVSNYLIENGYDVIDADKISRSIVEKGSNVLYELSRYFGEDIIREDGTLDRKLLAAKAFVSDKECAALNSIMHTSIKNRIYEEKDNLEKAGKEIIFIDAPLLFEVGLEVSCDFIWIVSAKEEIRISRVLEREQINKEDIVNRIKRQFNDEDRKLSFENTELIENNEGKEELYCKIEKLLKAHV